MTTKFSKQQVQRFTDIMGEVQKTTMMDSFKDTAFMMFLYVHGLKESDIAKNALEEFVLFSQYLESVGIGVASASGRDDKPFSFMFLDDAKELGATITEE